MAAPTVVGTAVGGRIGFGTYVCTPPAGAAHYLAFVGTNSMPNLIPPSGWTLLASNNGASTGSRWAIYTAPASASPGATWERGGTSSTGVQAVVVVGYDQAVTLATPVTAASATSPATTATGEGLALRLLTRLPSTNADPTYPTAATLGRNVSRQYQAAGNAVEVAVAHQAVSAAGAVATAAWSASTSGDITALTVMAYGAAPPAYETVVGASTASLASPAARWVKGTMRPVWSDGDTWSAILPTSTGHRRYADVDSPSAGAVVDSRQDARLTAVHYGGTTFVLRAHTSSSLFSSFDAAWSTIVNGASFPLTAADLDASPIALHRSPNGYLWAAVIAGSGAVQVTRSTDGGATWETPQTVVSFGSETGVVGFGQSGSTVVLVASLNAGVGRAVRSIDQATASITAGSWATEALPALPSGVTSDDHLAVASVPDGRVLAVAKTTDATTSGQPLIYLLARATNGTWTSSTIEPGPDVGGVRYTRPVLTVVGSNVVVMYGSIEDPKNLTIRTAALSALGTWSTRSALFTGPDWSDSAVLPPASDIRRHGTTFPVLAQQRADSTVALGWQDAPPPVREGSSVAGAVGSAAGTGHRLASGASAVAAVVGDLGSGLKRGTGSSAPGAEVAAMGSGTPVKAGASAVRAQASATGTGFTIRRGLSLATAQVAAVGSGAPAQAGSGSSVATATVTTVGVGSKRATGASTAGSVVYAAGAGSTVRRGSSTAAASVTAQGSGRRVESGRGHSTATALVATTGAGIKIAAGASVAHATVNTTGSGHKIEPGRGSSVTTAHATTVGVGYARHAGSSITTVTVTAIGTGHNPAGPDDVELVVVRGPYGTHFDVGSPRGTTLTITGPRR
ncbi:hypothetical protein ABRQ22_17180 [Cellulosimicrobium sp. ES-005]|uniref:Exo-alpha-sialidase n=1 Tax=Cellulosimicrobium sp. ES-005 TaxID=3163031 RepID=A0AAU8FZP9_9MICO